MMEEIEEAVPRAKAVSGAFLDFLKGQQPARNGGGAGSHGVRRAASRTALLSTLKAQGLTMRRVHAFAYLQSLQSNVKMGVRPDLEAFQAPEDVELPDLIDHLVTK